MSLDDKIRNAQSAKGSADRGRKRVNYELRIRRLLKDAGIYSYYKYQHGDGIYDGISFGDYLKYKMY